MISAAIHRSTKAPDTNDSSTQNAVSLYLITATSPNSVPRRAIPAITKDRTGIAMVIFKRKTITNRIVRTEDNFPQIVLGSRVIFIKTSPFSWGSGAGNHIVQLLHPCIGIGYHIRTVL